MIRQPIVVLVGHVDHGKSSILERIREISITKGESGGITQSIKSYTVPLTTIKNVCGNLLEELKIKLTIPGLLFIDTPGHAAFTNLRKRGGNLADIAILVIDINEGLKPQTIEALDILKSYKTPFIIALNKIDLIPGWRKQSDNIIQNIDSQSENVKQKIDNLLYELLGKLYEHDIKTERFDRVDDYTKQIAIVPCSAKTNEGLSELLMILTGLAQRYLESTLKIHVKGPGKATVLEVKEDKKLGTTIDVIVYDGTLKVNDEIVVGTINEPIVTKIRSLFEIEKNKLITVKSVNAASGVKIFAPKLKDVIAGMPLMVVNKNLSNIKKQIQKEIEEVIIETDKEGIVIKADALGSLEALISLLKEHDIKIKRASIGPVTKKDISDATAEKDPLNKIILAFNVECEVKGDLKIIQEKVIYKIIDDFQAWLIEEKKKLESKELKNLIKPCKIELLKGYVFRQSNPAIIGAEIKSGILTTNTPLMNEDGKALTKVKSIQHEKKNINELGAGNQAAISLPGLIVGRQIKEGETLYSDVPQEDFVELKKLAKYLNRDEIELLKEIAKIKRKLNPLWGI
tara:strand:- start:15808 stop:17523 length:1716 start_codon:yes stop_codon:yes gene_type:complete